MDKMKMIFDVESDGLYGDGFAFGYIILNDNFDFVSYGQCVSKVEIKEKWVLDYVIPNLSIKNQVNDNKELRDVFFNILQGFKPDQIWSDVNYPVETNFLRQIVMDNKKRMFNMPYPLYDISSLHDIKISRDEYFNSKLFNLYPNLIHSKSTYELKSHNPLHDSIASALLLLKSKKILQQYVDLKIYNI